jgi:hypothetical protein
MRNRKVCVYAFDAVTINIATSTLCPGAELTDAWGAIESCALSSCAEGVEAVEGQTTSAECLAPIAQAFGKRERLRSDVVDDAFGFARRQQDRT